MLRAMEIFSFFVMILSTVTAQQTSNITNQEEIQCSADKILSFVDSSVNISTCTDGINSSLQMSTNLTELMKTIPNSCKPSCAGKVIDWLKNTSTSCNGTSLALDVELSCYQNDINMNQFCRYYFGELTTRVEAAYNACQDAMCNDSCRSELNGIRNELGCCYQMLYNNTVWLGSLLRRELIGDELHDEIHVLALGNFTDSPWVECNITAPEQCENNPATGSTTTPTTTTGAGEPGSTAAPTTTTGELGLQTGLSVIIGALSLTFVDLSY